MAEGAGAAALRWMPNFPEESGKRRLSWHDERLTAGLPDVPTSGALHSHLIRLVERSIPAWVWCAACLQGAEISVSVQCGVAGRGIPQANPPFIKGSTR